LSAQALKSAKTAAASPPFPRFPGKFAERAASPGCILWAENCNVTRRVLGIADQSDSRMALAVGRFGRVKPERLEIVRVEFVRGAKQLSREEFCGQLRGILAVQFPDETLDRVSVAADLEHSLSRVYVRGVSRRASHSCAFLVPPGELPEAIESGLTLGLLWLHALARPPAPAPSPLCG
jgi:hypothetical protein